MRRQLVPGPVVRLTVIKAKTRPGIEAKMHIYLYVRQPHHVIVIRRRITIKISPRTPPTAIPMIWLVVRKGVVDSIGTTVKPRVVRIGVVDSVGSCTLDTSKNRAAYSSR